MKKRIGIVLGTSLALSVAYLGGIGYYAEKFTPNTRIGAVQIGNLTLSQAQTQLEQEVASKTIVLKENGQVVGEISLASLGYDFHTSQTLEQMYQAQNPVTWAIDWVKGTHVTKVLADQVDIDSTSLEEALAQVNVNNENRRPAQDAAITYEEGQGYEVTAGSPGTQIDMKRLSRAILASVEDETHEVNLEDTYVQPEIEADSDVIKDNMARIQSVLNTKITLQIAGDEVTIPADLIESWIQFDDANQVLVDRTQVAGYLEGLNDQYSTFNKVRTFESTLRGQVEVQPGILGWSIDVETEIDNIQADLQAGRDISRKPAFTGVGTRLGEADEIGNTYVEVDLANQMMYLYVEGEVIVATNIVSGQIGAETVPGANAVIEMLTNTNLVGYNQILKTKYSVPVQYWIRFDYDAQGIHDASWQSSFGGDAYLTRGSLGCINTPLDQVALIYEYVTYGTPVIVY